MPPAVTVTEHRRPRGRLRAPVLAVALVAVGLLVVGCGGGGKSPGVANVSTSTTSSSHSSSSSTANGDGGTPLSGGAPSTGSGSSGQHSNFAIQTGNPQKALKLSECMRANGVPNFPDPNGQGVIQGSGIDPNTPGFQKAQQACAKKIGGGVGTPSPAQIAQAEAAALKFSQCMRSHGVSDFPDPQFKSAGGGVSIRISGHAGSGSSSDLDPNSPIFQKAQKTCGSLLPGRAGQKVGP
jgi:hypothetical protein